MHHVNKHMCILLFCSLLLSKNKRICIKISLCFLQQAGDEKCVVFSCRGPQQTRARHAKLFRSPTCLLQHFVWLENTPRLADVNVSCFLRIVDLGLHLRGFRLWPPGVLGVHASRIRSQGSFSSLCCRDSPSIVLFLQLYYRLFKEEVYNRCYCDVGRETLQGYALHRALGALTFHTACAYAPMDTSGCWLSTLLAVGSWKKSLCLPPWTARTITQSVSPARTLH